MFGIWWSFWLGDWFESQRCFVLILTALEPGLHWAISISTSSTVMHSHFLTYTFECNWSLIDKSGRPNVHPDDDLIVSHIALDIGTEEKMNQLMKWQSFNYELLYPFWLTCQHLLMTNMKSNEEFSKYRRLDDLGVAYRENVSVPKGSGGAGSVLCCNKLSCSLVQSCSSRSSMLCHFVASKLRKPILLLKHCQRHNRRKYWAL